MGFVADPEPVKNQLAAISTVCQEYAEPLERGLVDPNDPDKGLAAFQQKLKKLVLTRSLLSSVSD